MTVLVPRGEPGDPLRVIGRVVDGEEKPLAGVLVYAYQTSARGWYAADAPHVSGPSGDEGHARLFGYCRTDDGGRFELATVRPGGYPRSSLPSHIHVELTGPDVAARVTEIRFEDDPRLTAEEREASLRAGFAIVPVERGSDGLRCSVEFALERAAKR